MKKILLAAVLFAFGSALTAWAADAKVQAAFTDDEGFKAVKEGFKNAEGVSRMKAVEGLSDDEIKAVVAQVRSFKK